MVLPSRSRTESIPASAREISEVRGSWTSAATATRSNGSAAPPWRGSCFSPHPAASPSAANSAASAPATSSRLSNLMRPPPISFLATTSPTPRPPPRHAALERAEQPEEADRERRQDHDGGEQARREQLGRRLEHQVAEAGV